jgi:ceramide glucosyltransferase
MNDVVSPLASLCVAAAALGCLYLLTGCVALATFAARRRTRRAVTCTPVPVTILKPLHGAEPCLSRRLSSFCRQDYGAPVQVICGAQAPGDPAVAIARLLATSPEGPRFDLVIDTRAHGSNPKISNLMNMLPAAQHDLLVMADSDMEVGPDYLARVVAELQQPGVGAVTCLYHGVALSGRWSRHAALGINTHFLPNVVTALTLRLARPCFGSTIAISRRDLMSFGVYIWSFFGMRVQWRGSRFRVAADGSLLSDGREAQA